MAVSLILSELKGTVGPCGGMHSTECHFTVHSKNCATFVLAISLVSIDQF